MGHQIYAGGQSICFTDGAWLVVNWCNRYTPPIKPAGMSDVDWGDLIGGSTNIPVEAVRRANQHVPDTYGYAYAANLLQGEYRGVITPEIFNQCRNFLRYAADKGLAITGSY